MQKEETRRIILASAYSLFGKKGYGQTTMRELARHADVGLGTIFKHFPDKPSLLISTFAEDLDAVLHNCFETVPVTNVKMQLTHITAELYDFLAGNVSFSRTLLTESLFLEGSHAGILADKISFLREKIESLLKAAIERKELEQKIEIKNVYLTLQSYFLLGLIAGLREPELNVKKQTMLFASLLDGYLAGLAKSG